MTCWPRPRRSKWPRPKTTTACRAHRDLMFKNSERGEISKEHRISILFPTGGTFFPPNIVTVLGRFGNYSGSL